MFDPRFTAVENVARRRLLHITEYCRCASRFLNCQLHEAQKKHSRSAAAAAASKLPIFNSFNRNAMAARSYSPALSKLRHNQ